MILINSHGVHISGASLLLEYFIKKLSKSSRFILIQDKRNTNDLSTYAYETYFSESFIDSQILIYKNRSKVKSIFCFSNFPPVFTVKAKVFVYFHNPYLANKDFSNLDLPFKKKIFYSLKKTLLKLTYKNSDNFIFQTKYLAKSFGEIYHSKSIKKIILPFFDESLYVNYKGNKKIKNHFTYISYPLSHKNHLRLINAWKLFAKKSNKPVLNLTISSDGSGLHIVKKIDEINRYLGYESIVNHGIVNHKKSLYLTSVSEYTIFPSLNETFGMGLLEGVILENKILCSDIDVFRELIEDAIFFNPLSELEIYNSLMLTNQVLIKPNILIENNIESLVNIL